MRRIVAAILTALAVLILAAPAHAKKSSVTIQDFTTVVPEGIPDGVVVIDLGAASVRRLTITVTEDGHRDYIDNWVVALNTPGPFDPYNPGDPSIGVLAHDLDPHATDLSVNRYYDPALHLEDGDYLVVYADALANGQITLNVRVRFVPA